MRINRCPGGKTGGGLAAETPTPPTPLPVSAEPRAVRSPLPGSRRPRAPRARQPRPRRRLRGAPARLRPPGHGEPRPPRPGAPNRSPRTRRRTAIRTPDGRTRAVHPDGGAARAGPLAMQTPPSPAPRSGPYLRRRLRLSARRLRLQWRRRLPLCRCRGCAAPRRAALFRQWKTPGSDAGGDRSGAGALPGPPGFLPPPGGALTQGRRRRLPAPPAGGAAREGPGGRWGGLGPERGRRRREGLLANRACLRGWETEPRRDPRRASGA